MMKTGVGSQNGLVQVLIVDDHPTVREGLRYRLSSQTGITVCGEASGQQDALEKIAQLSPDVVIVDIGLKNSSGLDLIKVIRSRYEKIKVLVHSMYDEMIYADRCLRAGAMGYVNKEADPSDVITALREIVAGRIFLSSEMTDRMLSRTARGLDAKTDSIDTLTDRQLEVFRLMGEGKTAAEIAKQLHISVHTVETHRENIKQKLDVTNLAELTRLAVLWENANRQ